MTKKQRLTISGCLYVVGELIAVYGAGFSWRQALVGGIALLVWQLADETFKAAGATPAFHRYQFRLGLGQLVHALQTAGLYGDDLAEAAAAICEDMPGKGWIIFTWLEPELFYIKTTNQFSSQLELSIDLLSFGSRAPDREFQLSDTIQLKSTSEGYELILVTREQRYSSPGTTRDKGLVLFRLPYKFLWSLQGDPYQGHQKAKEILTAAGYAYHSHAEVAEAWDYRNEYGSLRWWDV